MSLRSMAPIPDNKEAPGNGCREIADTETPSVNIAIDSGDSDNDEVIVPADMGYQLLPQEITGEGRISVVSPSTIDLFFVFSFSGAKYLTNRSCGY